MPDRPDVFLDRLKRIHAARAAIALMSGEERIALARARPGRFTAAWEYQARDEQLPPPSAWRSAAPIIGGRSAIPATGGAWAETIIDGASATSRGPGDDRSQELYDHDRS